MDRWIECRTEFLEADVVRWREGIWERKNDKPKKVGEREVVAEVIQDAGDGWLTLLVRACTVIEDNSGGRKAYGLAEGVEVRRQRKTICNGRPQRLHWSDESARAVIAGERADKERAARARERAAARASKRKSGGGKRRGRKARR